MSATGELLTIELAYALPERQWLESLSVPAGTVLLEAVRMSALLREQPGLQPVEALTLGIWGKVEKQPEARVLQDGDRIEIYRPLLIDPKEARRARAARVRGERGAGG